MLICRGALRQIDGPVLWLATGQEDRDVTAAVADVFVVADTSPLPVSGRLCAACYVFG